MFFACFFQIKPFCERVFSRRSEALEALHFEEITGVCQMVDFMTPPVGLSVAATLNDQIPAQKKNSRVIVQPQRHKYTAHRKQQEETQRTYRVKFSMHTPYLVSVKARPTFTLNSGSNSSTKLIRPLSRFMYMRKESFTTSQRRDQRKHSWWWPMQFRPWIRWPPDLLKMGPSLIDVDTCGKDITHFHRRCFPQNYFLKVSAYSPLGPRSVTKDRAPTERNSS